MSSYDPVQLSGKSPEIVVIGSDSVAGAVMMVPALQEIRDSHAGSTLTYVGPDAILDLFHAMEIIETGIAAGHDQGTLLRSVGSLLRVSRLVRSRRPAVVASLIEGLHPRLLAFLSGARHRIGPAHSRKGILLNRPVVMDREMAEMHPIFRHLQLLHRAGLNPRNPLECAGEHPAFSVTRNALLSKAARHALEILEIPTDLPIVGLYAGPANHSAGRWFPERYAAVVRKLREDFPFTTVFCGPKHDRPVAQLVCQELGQEGVRNACGRLSLTAMASLVGTCRLFLGSDSGLLHLAGLFGVPQVALYGPTHPAECAPLSRKTVVVRKNVCGPCNRGVCPLDKRCMKALTVAEVVDRARALLQKEYTQLS